ncbi:hypothetical protein [Bacillus sp. RO2]|uniref:hypothetical protein n=1 Tax=Bacillus sp. RO2 TaxID=2723913 RepID=UPI001F114879|nr:hypothetical protein [Bacillus sp. RO2]
MMKVTIKKGLMVPIANFMYEIELVRKQSRMRRQLIKILNEHEETLKDDKRHMLEEHSKKDEEGKALINDGQYQLTDKDAFTKDLKELTEEEIVIEGEGNREMIRSIRSTLKKLEDNVYKGSDSEIYDYLCDQFSVDELEGGEN